MSLFFNDAKYPWVTGPLRPTFSAFDRVRGKEVGSSTSYCYPNEQYHAFDRIRHGATGEVLCLGPQMAKAILLRKQNPETAQQMMQKLETTLLGIISKAEQEYAEQDRQRKKWEAQSKT